MTLDFPRLNERLHGGHADPLGVLDGPLSARAGLGAGLAYHAVAPLDHVGPQRQLALLLSGRVQAPSYYVLDDPDRFLDVPLAIRVDYCSTWLDP